MNEHKELSCPRCAARLTPSGDAQWRCGGCGGTLMGREAVVAFLDSAEAGQLLAARPMGYRTSAHDQVTLGAAPPPGEVRYLKCPMCPDQMLRTRFLADDAAVSDVCVLHAVWFDVGELERAVAGLARAGADCREALRPLIADHFRGDRPPEGVDTAS